MNLLPNWWAASESSPSPQRADFGGKLSGAGLPEEYLMERVVRNLSPSHPTWRPSVALCSWEGIKCDGAQKVTWIRWDWRQLRGTLSWALPPGLVYFGVQSNEIHGEVEFSQLPLHLQHFYLSENGFTGKVDLAGMPRSLDCIALDCNLLSGEVEFHALPPNLRMLMLQKNPDLTGILEENVMPRKAEYNFARTQIVGWNGMVQRLIQKGQGAQILYQYK